VLLDFSDRVVTTTTWKTNQREDTLAIMPSLQIITIEDDLNPTGDEEAVAPSIMMTSTSTMDAKDDKEGGVDAVLEGDQRPQQQQQRRHRRNATTTAHPSKNEEVADHLHEEDTRVAEVDHSRGWNYEKPTEDTPCSSSAPPLRPTSSSSSKNTAKELSSATASYRAKSKSASSGISVTKKAGRPTVGRSQQLQTSGGESGGKKQTKLSSFFSARPWKGGIGEVSLRPSSTTSFLAVEAGSSQKGRPSSGVGSSIKTHPATTPAPTSSTVVSLSQGRKKALRAIVLGGGSGASTSGIASNKNRGPPRENESKSAVEENRIGICRKDLGGGCGGDGSNYHESHGPPADSVDKECHEEKEDVATLTPTTGTPKQTLLERFERQSNSAAPALSTVPSPPSSSKENCWNSALTNNASTRTNVPALASPPSPESSPSGTLEKLCENEVIMLAPVASPSASNLAWDSETPDERSVETNAAGATGTETSSPTTTTPMKQKLLPRRRIAPTAVVLNAVGATTQSVENDMESPTHPTSVNASPPLPSNDNPKLQALIEKYEPRAQELLQQCREAERVRIPVPDLDEGLVEDESADKFPDAAVHVAAALMEGSSDTLSSLARQVLERLSSRLPALNEDLVSSKLKVLATRKCYGKKPKTSSALNVFEDEDPDHVWRWELTVVELLPQASVPAVKKARAALRRLSSYWQATSQLVSAVNAALVNNGCAAGEDDGLDDKALAKIVTLEEKVLKYEREDEKLRLSAQSKATSRRLQDEERQRKTEESRRKREEEQERRREAARIKQLKNDEAARLKEALKQKKQEEAELKAKQEQEKLFRQKSSFRSFFSGPRASVGGPAAKPKPAASENLSKAEATEIVIDAPKQQGKVHVDPRAAAQPAASSNAKSFDSNGFRALINSCTCLELPFQRQRRRRRSRRVPVLVTVTIFPDDDAEFGALPYAEQQEVTINNRYRFFLFHEDVRPPYHGTWSKSSRAVNGRRPLGRESSLDYDNDSEAEWEEEDEVGEDLDNDDGEEEEEELGEQYEKDGWLDDDELRKDAASELSVCLVAPMNGVPLVELPARDNLSQSIEGLDLDNGLSLLRSHHAIVLSDTPCCVDVFPPDERDVEGTSVETDNKKDLADDDLKALCRFVHHSTLGSRDKVVDELRSKFESITNSRAQSVRILDSIAEKKRHPSGAYYWEVKVDVIEKLDLQDLRDAEFTISSPVLDVEKAKRVASFVHHKTLKSKERLVEEVRAQCDVTTKSEAQRLLEYVAEKKTDSGNVYWAIKPETQQELGLENLPSTPPASRKDTPQVTNSGSNTGPAAESKKRKNTEVLPSQGGEAKPKKRLSLQPVDASSAMMLSMFLKKK
jgi:hypothetical protein